MKTGADIYAELEAAWKSRYNYIAKRIALEDAILKYDRQHLEAAKNWCVIGHNTGMIRDKRAAKAIYAIINEVLEDYD